MIDEYKEALDELRFSPEAKRRMVQRIEEDLGQPATLVVTGGVAKYVAPLCRHPLTYDPELLMKGLALLYQLNAPPPAPRHTAAGGRRPG